MMSKGKYFSPLHTLLLKDEEDNDPEVVKRRRRAMFAANAKLKKEEDEKKRLGYCPKCHLLLLTTRKCPLGHVF